MTKLYLGDEVMNKEKDLVVQIMRDWYFAMDIYWKKMNTQLNKQSNKRSKTND